VGWVPKIKTVRGIENRKGVSQKEWLVARKKLLLKEKTFSKQRDALNLQRRKLPWLKIEREYVFDGPAGKVTIGLQFPRPDGERSRRKPRPSAGLGALQRRILELLRVRVRVRLDYIGA